MVKVFSVKERARVGAILGAIVWLVLNSDPVFSEPRVAILAIELDDMSVLPKTPAEIIRTASLKPFVRRQLPCPVGDNYLDRLTDM